MSESQPASRCTVMSTGSGPSLGRRSFGTSNGSRGGSPRPGHGPAECRSRPSCPSVSGPACRGRPGSDRPLLRLDVFARLKQIALESYDRIVGLVLDQIAVDGAITKSPLSQLPIRRGGCGWWWASRSCRRSRRAAEAHQLQQLVGDDPVTNPRAVAARRMSGARHRPPGQQRRALMPERLGQPEWQRGHGPPQ